MKGLDRAHPMWRPKENTSHAHTPRKDIIIEKYAEIIWFAAGFSPVLWEKFSIWEIEKNDLLSLQFIQVNRWF